MERIKKKHDVILQALSTLKKSINLLNDLEEQKYYESLRDSVIARFTYSIDLFWKFLKLYLQEKHNIETAATPRIVLRDSLAANIINQDEFEILIKAVRTRNLTSHTYNEPLAEEIIEKIPNYYEEMQKIINRLKL